MQSLPQLYVFDPAGHLKGKVSQGVLTPEAFIDLATKLTNGQEQQ